MSRENVEVARANYAAGRFGARLIDPDVEYVNPAYAVEPGTLRGPRSSPASTLADALRRFARLREG
jgi:hypothetical protein